MTTDPLYLLTRPSSPEPAPTPEEVIVREIGYVRLRQNLIIDQQAQIARAILASVGLPPDNAAELHAISKGCGSQERSTNGA